MKTSPDKATVELTPLPEVPASRWAEALLRAFVFRGGHPTFQQTPTGASRRWVPPLDCRRRTAWEVRCTLHPRRPWLVSVDYEVRRVKLVHFLGVYHLEHLRLKGNVFVV